MLRVSHGLDVALEALTEGWRSKRVNLDDLNRIVKNLRVQRGNAALPRDDRPVKRSGPKGHRGALASVRIGEALSITQQIAGALEAAHEREIIHRDLKPANIKVRLDGMVKVLDFGLAKAMEPSVAVSPSTESTTVTSPMLTRAGTVLGTAAYMSPEQARGTPVDERADIWAFGCVVFEMITGRAVFARETVTATVAAVIGAEPPWAALQPKAPPPIHGLLQWCLEKDPPGRLRDIADASRFLGEPDRLTPGASTQPRGSQAVLQTGQLSRHLARQSSHRRRHAA